jgi:atypical dual specificity phosphatase
MPGFSWVIPGLLAGSSLPGSGGDPAADLAELARLGVYRLVSLTDQAADFAEACRKANLRWEYFPIDEFDIPSDPETFAGLVRRLLVDLKAGRAVCIHCFAGVGRTGLLLSCLLGRFLGLGPEEAIRRVRSARPALETPDQELFVRRFLERRFPQRP